MIVFDFDGVISDSVKWFKDLAVHLSPTNTQAILTWMIEQASDPWLQGSWSDERFITELNTRFSLRVTIDDVEQACRTSMRIDENVRAIITRLGRAAIFTDNPQVRAHIIQEQVPVRVTWSQSVGKRKHDGFEAFIAQSGIRAGLFIDDYPPNIEAARKAGFDTLRWQLGKDPYEKLEATVTSFERR